jgi:hypothetical protein
MKIKSRLRSGKILNTQKPFKKAKYSNTYPRCAKDLAQSRQRLPANISYEDAAQASKIHPLSFTAASDHGELTDGVIILGPCYDPWQDRLAAQRAAGVDATAPETALDCNHDKLPEQEPVFDLTEFTELIQSIMSEIFKSEGYDMEHKAVDILRDISIRLLQRLVEGMFIYFNITIIMKTCLTILFQKRQISLMLLEDRVSVCKTGSWSFS